MYCAVVWQRQHAARARNTHTPVDLQQCSIRDCRVPAADEFLRAVTSRERNVPGQNMSSRAR